MSRPNILLLLLPLLCQLACTPPSHFPREQGGPVLTESLFDYKERTLSEEDIRRILDGHIEVRDTLRLAVFNFGGAMSRHNNMWGSAWRWHDEESMKSQQRLMDTLTYALTRSPRVQEVVLLPMMVTGAKPNIHQLRESAVRVQADMLLIFSLHSDIFQKYRAFKKDEAKAFATGEVVLMDIRTGVIPHTSVVTRSAHTKKVKEDYSEMDMQNRVLHEAALTTLLEAGNKVTAYLNGQK